MPESLTTAAIRPRAAAKLSRSQPQQIDQGRGRLERIGDHRQAIEGERRAQFAGNLGHQQRAAGGLGAVALREAMERRPVAAGRAANHECRGSPHPSALRS
jgi:hypothetical protein